MNDQLETNRRKKYFCRCLNYPARTQEAVEEHQELYFNNETCTPIISQKHIGYRNLKIFTECLHTLI